MLAVELREANHVVDDLMLILDPDLGDLGDGVEQVDLRTIADEVAKDLATSHHTRVSVRGEASARSPEDVARHIIRNLLRCATHAGAGEVTVVIGGGFSKVFVEISHDGAVVGVTREPARDGGPGAEVGLLPVRLALDVAVALARSLGGDVTEMEPRPGRTGFELSLPKVLGNQWTKVTIADSIFDPSPDGPSRSQISAVLDTGGPEMAYQPIMDLRSHMEGAPMVIGHEALARFPDGSPAQWLEAAGHAGSRLDLELSAMGAAVAGFGAAHSGFLTVNLSDQTLLSPDLPAALEGIEPGLVVLELSDAALIKSYELTRKAVEGLRDRGYRLAIDNVGSGEIDLWSIIRLQPEILKVDMSLVRGVDAQASNRAIIRGLAAMAADLGILTVAEGIETIEERDALVDIGVEFGQGYLLGRPHRL